jgi:hypothetical protein
MKIVDTVEAPKMCTVCDIEDGGTFEWDGSYYIRPGYGVRRTGDIGGVGLATGDFVSNSVTLMVRRVTMEARVL